MLSYLKHEIVSKYNNIQANLSHTKVDVTMHNGMLKGIIR